MKSLRVVYLMHVDARWIRQRPHVLADELRESGVLVDVRYARAWRKKALVPGRGLAPARALPAVPPITEWVRWRCNTWLARLVLSLTSVGRPPDVVWLTHPRMWWMVPKRWRSRVVYDAMDIAAAFPGRNNRYLLRSEEELARAACHVFCSSTRIAEHLRERYGRTDAVSILRNAVDGRTSWGSTADHHASTGNSDAIGTGDGAGRLLYFGTIAEWLDMPLLLLALDKYPQLVIDLVGPAEISLPDHPRLRHHAAVLHAELPALAVDASALIMPFVVNDLVLGVDPVKLYEYVALRKPAIACRYPEVDRFAGHVHLYRDDVEFLDLVGNALDGRLAVSPDPDGFLRRNTWTSRAADARATLETLR